MIYPDDLREWRRQAEQGTVLHDAQYIPRILELIKALDAAEEERSVLRAARDDLNEGYYEDRATIARLRATIARVEALADEWEAEGRRIGYDGRGQHENDLLYYTVVPALRAALNEGDDA